VYVAELFLRPSVMTILKERMTSNERQPNDQRPKVWQVETAAVTEACHNNRFH